MKSLFSVAALCVQQCSAIFFQKDSKEVHPEAHIQNALLETLSLSLSDELRQKMGGIAADPAGDLLGSVASMITEEMMPGIISAHNSTQQELDGFLKTVNDCPSPILSSQPATFLQTQSSQQPPIAVDPVDGDMVVIKVEYCTDLYLKRKGADVVLDRMPNNGYTPEFYWQVTYPANQRYDNISFCSGDSCLQAAGAPSSPTYAFSKGYPARPNGQQWKIKGYGDGTMGFQMVTRQFDQWFIMFTKDCTPGARGGFLYDGPTPDIYKGMDKFSFAAAPTTTTTTTTTVLGGPGWISGKMGALLACRQREAAAANENQACQEDLKTLEGVKNSSCNNLKVLETKPMPDHLCHPTDPYDQWLITAQAKTNELKDELAKGKAGCGNATQLYDDKAPKCAGTKGHVDGNKTECDRLQAEAENGICSGPLAAQQQACDDYGECYDNAIAAYQEKEPTIKALHRNWTVQWRVLKRMDCLLGVMAKGGTNDDVDQCKAKLWPTDHLDLAYPNFPEKETCPGAGAMFLQTEQSSSEGFPLPCGDDFIRKHYGNNPEGAPAAPCIPCTTPAPPTIAATTATTTAAPHFEPAYGGQGGADFSDWASGRRGDIESVCAWSGGYVDAIQVSYRGIGPGHRHGGDGGGKKCIHLAVGEYITKMHINYGGFVDAMSVVTSHGQQVWWGGEGGTSVAIEPHSRHLVSIYGKAGGYLDALGTVWQY